MGCFTNWSYQDGVPSNALSDLLQPPTRPVRRDLAASGIGTVCKNRDRQGRGMHLIQAIVDQRGSTANTPRLANGYGLAFASPLNDLDVIGDAGRRSRR